MICTWTAVIAFLLSPAFIYTVKLPSFTVPSLKYMHTYSYKAVKPTFQLKKNSYKQRFRDD